MNTEISLSVLSTFIFRGGSLEAVKVCMVNVYRPTYVLLCQLIDICRNCLEPVCGFCCGTKLKNIGAGSVQGEDFKTVGPGGAQVKIRQERCRRLKAREEDHRVQPKLFITSASFTGL